MNLTALVSRSLRRSFLGLVAAALASAPLLALPAFPGAEGFGANATGGRGGSVYVVTNLNDSGPGSFRDAVSQPNRYVVFAVGGVIRITSRVAVRNNITIAGQTAPGGGITIYGNGVSFSNAHNTICRYIRFRQGINGDGGTDAVGIASGDAMIFDHVSASWGRDETFSVSGTPSNITLQDCIVGQGLLAHSAGGLMQTDSGVSVFRTLYTDNYMRNPKVKGVHEFTNNVVYNWGSGGGYILGDSAGQSYANIVRNYFIAGPTSPAQAFTRGNLNFHVFVDDNVHDANRNGALDGATVPPSGYTTVDFVPVRYPYPAVATLLSPADAYAHVVAHAGASLRRDSVDQFMIAELTSLGLQGAHIVNESAVGGPGLVADGPAPLDTDGDGMPDWWESAAGTNPALADHNGDLNGDGYTNLENYLNALAPTGVPAARILGIDTDTGVATGDGITSDATLVLRGTSAPGRVLTLARVDLGAIGTTLADPSGNWTFNYTATPLPDRYYAFTAVADLGAGQISPPTAAFVVKVDTTAADAPSISGLALTPAYTFNGLAGAGDAVSVSLSGSGVVATATADHAGRWNAPYTGAPLAPGVYTFTASAVDLAGNAGPASAPYIVDTGLTPPVFTAIESDTGTSSTDQLTRDTSLILRGTAPAGSTVTLARAGLGNIGNAVADAVGNWSFDTTATILASGSYTFTAAASTGAASSPVSTPFVVTVDTVAPTIDTISRFNPATASTSATTLVFRVTFAEPVVNVDIGDFILALSGTGMTGTIASLATVNARVYDVTVTGAGGDGTIRLDRRSNSTIADLAGNAGSSGTFTGGQSYTIRLPGSGVWSNTETGGLWSDASNWEDNVIASGSGATADFAARDIDGDITVQLDSSRTLGRLVFGDVDQTSPGTWRIGHNGNPANALAFATPAGSPTIQVNFTGAAGQSNPDIATAGAAYPAILDAAVNTATGLTKSGWGTAILNQIGAFSGPISVTQGRLKLGAGASLTVPSIALAVSTQFEVAGGTFVVTGDATQVSGTGVGYIVSAGSASFQRIVPTNARNNLVKVTGGSLTATELNFPRSADAASSYGAGLVIEGGVSSIGTVGLGTVNSWGAMAVDGGRITIGQLTAGWQQSAARGGQIRQRGGELIVTDPAHGLVLSRKYTALTPNNANNIAELHLLGGVAALEKLTLGYDATVNAGSATVNLSGGSLLLGAGGIVRHGVAPFVTNLNLTDGVLGASADWSTTVPMTLLPGGTVTIHTATATGLPRDITLGGALSGAGGFVKTGPGTLTLSAANTFTGAVAVNAGRLRLTGTLAAGADLTLDGGTLAGNGTVQRSVVLNSGILAPEGTAALTVDSPSVTWHGGARLALTLDANNSSGQLAVTGALMKGTPGSYAIAFTTGSGFVAGNSYTIATFGSTTFTAADFIATGLPAGHVAFFSLTGTSLRVTVKAPAPLALGNLRQFYNGTARVPATVTTPAGLNVTLTYDGSATAPIYPGTYAVIGQIADPVYTGIVSGTLIVTTTAVVRHALTLAGSVDGSVHVLLPENIALTGDVSQDLLVPGTPTVRLNGRPIFAGIIDAAGLATPSTHELTMSGGAVLRYAVRRVNPVPLPFLAAPQPPAGTRDVALNHDNQGIGDFTTLRNLTLSGGAGTPAIPPGAYGEFTLSGSTGLVLGVAGATTPAIYHLQRLTLNGASTLQVVGPVLLRLGGNLVVNHTAGSAANARWLTVEIAQGGATLHASAKLHGEIVAPNGRITLGDGATLNGNLTADQLVLQTDALLHEVAP